MGRLGGECDDVKCRAVCVRERLNWLITDVAEARFCWGDDDWTGGDAKGLAGVELARGDADAEFGEPRRPDLLKLRGRK